MPHQPYKISAKAAEDLEQIWLYTTQQWSLDQANNYLQQIFEAIAFAAQHPLQGKDYSHLRAGYRRYKVQSHLIFYKISTSQGGIEVIRILHTSMDIPNRL